MGHVLGVSASHNGAACLLNGELIVAAIQEERLNRRKRAYLFGARRSAAIRYCLDAAGIRADDLDLVVVCGQASLALEWNDPRVNPDLQAVVDAGRLRTISHHLGHAIHAHATSGFVETTVVVVDGLGSPRSELRGSDADAAPGTAGDEGWEFASIYRFDGVEFDCLRKWMVDGGRWLVVDDPAYPHFGSIGGMYAAAAHQIFGDASEAGKVMGLAPYGTPTIPIEDFVSVGRRDSIEFSAGVRHRFSTTDRWPQRAQEYADLAASVQRALEFVLDHVMEQAARLTGDRRLAYSGGVALNGIYNEKLIRSGRFDDVYIPAACEDSGPAIGAAHHGVRELRVGAGRNLPVRPLRIRRDDMGIRYPATAANEAAVRVPGFERSSAPDHLLECARLLAEGKVIGWFQGGSELGPRALGQRSILADPRKASMKDVLNERVKRRECFRPFAPAVLAANATEWFDMGPVVESPFMLRVVPALERARRRIPAVVHVDGTARVQTVDAANGALHRLVSAFQDLTGIPVLLNTSFNVAGEPIVETPDDALWCALEGALDGCWLDGTLYLLVGQLPAVLERAIVVRVDAGASAAGPRDEIAVPSVVGATLAAVEGCRTVADVCARALTMQPDTDLDDIDILGHLLALRRVGVVDFRV